VPNKKKMIRAVVERECGHEETVLLHVHEIDNPQAMEMHRKGIECLKCFRAHNNVKEQSMDYGTYKQEYKNREDCRVIDDYDSKTKKIVVLVPQE